MFLGIDWQSTPDQGVTESDQGVTEFAIPGADPESIETAPRSGTNATSRSETQIWLIAVTLVACVTALAAVVVAFYLYRWRRILLTGHPNALVPEEWGAALREVSKVTSDLISNNRQNTEALSQHLETHSGAVQKMTGTFMSFKQSLDDKDAEIDRLRRGYDAHIYRKFLHRFIRVHQSLLECGTGNEVSASDIRNLTLILEDALEESGIALFEPEIGDDIRNLGERIADSPRVLETAEAEAHLTIAEINAPGYEVVSGEQPVVLVPAQVTVYRSSKVAQEV